MRRTAGYTWTDYKTNKQIAKELKITPILDKLLKYKSSWKQHVNRMPRNILPRVMKHYSPTGRRNHGRPLKRLLETWDRNGSTSGPTPWQIYDDDDDHHHHRHHHSTGSGLFGSQTKEKFYFTNNVPPTEDERQSQTVKRFWFVKTMPQPIWG